MLLVSRTSPRTTSTSGSRSNGRAATRRPSTAYRRPSLSNADASVHGRLAAAYAASGGGRKVRQSRRSTIARRRTASRARAGPLSAGAWRRPSSSLQRRHAPARFGAMSLLDGSPVPVPRRRGRVRRHLHAHQRRRAPRSTSSRRWARVGCSSTTTATAGSTSSWSMAGRVADPQVARRGATPALTAIAATARSTM